ncbi:MAG: MFS transporter [Chloroflexi bacterium]|nr:MFS transporter [Chloroflexota bacterium]
MHQTATEPKDSLVGNRYFMLLWTAQALTQTAQNGIFFVLMVIIAEATGSAAHLSVLVFSTVVPSALLGIAAGVVVDRHKKRNTLIATNFSRCVLVFGYLIFRENMGLLYLVNFSFSIISQFFGPAEAAAIPMLVSKKRLIAANSFFNLTFTASQFAGLVFPIPVLVKLVGPKWVLVGIAFTYALATILVALLPREQSPTSRERTSQGWIRGIVDELKDGWKLIHTSSTITLSMIHLTVASFLILVMSVLAAPFMKKVLGIRADDALFFLAPAAIGLLVGTTLVPILAKRWARIRLINRSLVAMGVTLMALGAIHPLVRYLVIDLMPHFGNPAPSITEGVLSGVMAIALLLGLEFALVTIPAQTNLQEQAPISMRGKVFATQLTFGNVASILPLLFIGGIADLFGINNIIFLLGCGILAAAIFSLRKSRGLFPEKPPID